MRCDNRRQIPAVSKVLDALGQFDLPRRFVVEIVRRKLSQIRASGAVSEFEAIVAHVRRSLDEFRASRLQPTSHRHYAAEVHVGTFNLRSLDEAVC